MAPWPASGIQCALLLFLLLVAAASCRAHAAYSIARDEPYDNETYIDVTLSFTRREDFPGLEQAYWPFLNKLCRNPRYLSAWHGASMGTYAAVEQWRKQLNVIGGTREVVVETNDAEATPGTTSTNAVTSAGNSTATTATTTTTTTTAPATTTGSPTAQRPSETLPPFFRQICTQTSTASDALAPFRPIDFRPWETTSSVTSPPSSVPDYVRYSDYPYLKNIASTPRVNVRLSLTTRQPVITSHAGEGQYIVTLFVRGTQDARDALFEALNGRSPIPELNEYYRNELGIVKASIMTEPAQLYWQTTDPLNAPVGLELDEFWSAQYVGISSTGLSIGWILIIIGGMLVFSATIAVFYFRRSSKRGASLHEGDDELDDLYDDTSKVGGGPILLDPLLDEYYDDEEYNGWEMEGGGGEGHMDDQAAEEGDASAEASGYYGEDGEWYWWHAPPKDGGQEYWDAGAVEEEYTLNNAARSRVFHGDKREINLDEEDLEPVPQWRPGTEEPEYVADRHTWKVPNTRADLENRIARKQYEKEQKSREALGRGSRVLGQAEEEDSPTDAIPEGDRILNHDIAKRRQAALQGGLTNLKELLAHRSGQATLGGDEDGTHRYRHPIERETIRPSASEWTLDAFEATMTIEEGFQLPPVPTDNPLLSYNTAPSQHPPTTGNNKKSASKTRALGSKADDRRSFEEVEDLEEEAAVPAAAGQQRPMGSKGGITAVNDPCLKTYNPKDVVILEEYYNDASDQRHQAIYGSHTGATSNSRAHLTDISAPSEVTVRRSALVLPPAHVKDTKPVEVRRLEAGVRARLRRQAMQKQIDEGRDIPAQNPSFRGSTVVIDSMDSISRDAKLAALRAQEEGFDGVEADEDGFLFYDEAGKGYRSVKEYDAARQVDPFSIRNKATLGLAARREALQVKNSLKQVINSLSDRRQGGGTYADAAARIAVNGAGPFGASKMSRFATAGQLFKLKEETIDTSELQAWGAAPTINITASNSDVLEPQSNMLATVDPSHLAATPGATRTDSIGVFGRAPVLSRPVPRKTTSLSTSKTVTFTEEEL